MNNSRLINTLKTFSEEEIRMFGKFIASPFHNNGKNCAAFYKQLLRFYPGFDSVKLTPETIYKNLYRGKKFNKQVIWNFTSALEKMAREFLKQIALKKNDFTGIGLMLSEFGKRKLPGNYSRTLAEMEKLLESADIDYDYFENMGHLENYKQEYFHLLDKIPSMSDSKLKASEYQVILFLRMTVGGLNDMKLLSDNYNFSFDVNIPLEFAKNIDLKTIVEYANKQKFKYSFLIEIYCLSLMMLLEPGQTVHFEKVFKLYNLHYCKFSMSEKRNMMHWIVNYCLQNMDIDENRFRRIIFDLNLFRLKEKLVYYPEEQMPKAIYTQILNSALAVKETEWAMGFIKNYSVKLQPGIRDSMISMAYAILYFHTGEYRKALKNLNNVELNDTTDKLLARTLTARSLYELGEMETLLHYIDSTRIFLVKNPSVSERSRIYIRNFFKYTGKIISIKEAMEPGKISLIRKEIEKTEELSNKKWLLEKLNELEFKK